MKDREHITLIVVFVVAVLGVTAAVVALFVATSPVAVFGAVINLVAALLALLVAVIRMC